jgi:hypothetical protein
MADRGRSIDFTKMDNLVSTFRNRIYLLNIRICRYVKSR